MNEQLFNIRHTTAHILAYAIRNLYPGTKIALGPVTENGFYYDFELKSPVSQEDFKTIEKEMRKLIAKNFDLKREEITFLEAKKLFKDEPYKLHIINEIETGKRDNLGMNGKVSIYTVGEFIDLCKGPHVKNTKEIKAFKLMNVSGAYFQGKEENTMLTRIHGTAFESEKELNEYTQMLEEAKKRDHKKLGKELDLFAFSDLVGAGLALWTPKGTIVRNLLDDYVWKLRKERGYEKVEIPHITKKDLYETSGHWDKFKDELFRITTREGHEFAMKPMNCPHHTQIYARKQWSYRELPQRYANSTMCYRDEQSGELSGLSRVRSFTQDDAHVFCRDSQVKVEFKKIWDIVHIFYKSFGFELRVRLSLHDPNNKKAYLGSEERWEKAENMLREIAKEEKADYFEGVGEAAFYGPKLDFMAKDSLGREWQVATIQLDMNMPERFDLFCINEQGDKERIVMIHAAIMGSIERFLSVLIEHTAGNFPAWLSPIQVALLPVGESHEEFTFNLKKILELHNIRCEIFTGSSLGKRIREATLQKVPFFAILGDKEIDQYDEKKPMLAIRKRGEESTTIISLNDLIQLLR